MQDAGGQTEKQEPRREILSVRAEWSGPLPPPEALEAFNRVIPDGAVQILEEWRTETSHRRDLERRTVRFDIAERIAARVLSFVFAIAALGTAGYCAAVGQAWPAAVIGGGTIAAVVAAMLRRKE